MTEEEYTPEMRIEAVAGMTLALNIDVRPAVRPDEGKTGALRVVLEEKAGGEKYNGTVYLTSRFQPDLPPMAVSVQNGVGLVRGLPAGAYALSARKPAVPDRPQPPTDPVEQPHIDQRIYFGNGEFEVPATELVKLDQIERYLLSLPAAESTQVICTGHASTPGSAALNDRISLQRAISVRKNLEARGLTRKVAGLRFATNYVGERGKTKETDEAQVKENRRVEFRIERGPRTGTGSP